MNLEKEKQRASLILHLSFEIFFPVKKSIVLQSDGLQAGQTR